MRNFELTSYNFIPATNAKKFTLNLISFFNDELNYLKSNEKHRLLSNFVESSRSVKKTSGVILPLRIVKYPFGLDKTYETNYNISTPNLFNLKFNDKANSLTHKTVPHSTLFSIKQTRYTKKTAINSVTKYKHHEVKDGSKLNFNGLATRVRYSGKPILFNNSVFEQNGFESINFYKLLKKNKNRLDLIPVNLARRLLRTRRTLVLPAHINITLVTNSFDVIHSWFVPGLGIKIDCVPGRSTHHTFFIDNVGFYYGQCAEICGRYHHHMPIRVCALPFEHFLV